jgi:GH25 family lysozyme M1 (1,4-beta-N-acetylmuramidase)
MATTLHRFAHSALLLLPLTVAACSGGPGENVGASNDAVTEKCGASANGAVQGRDVSVYQGDFDWNAEHVAFGYTRVSDGLGNVDSTFAENWAHLKDEHIRRGAYQFFEPSENATDQANLVVSKVGKLGAGDLPAVIDVEVTDGASPHEMADAIRTWLTVVEKGTGLRPIIYVGSYFWQDNVGATDFGDYPIWIAAYGPACPSLPPGWSNWAFWQYSDGGGSLDHDVFNGSLAELDKLEGGQTPAAPATLYTTAVAYNADDKLQVFSRGGGDALYTKSQKVSGSGWTDWDDLDGVLSRDVTVAKNKDGRLEVFGIGGGNHMFHKWETTDEKGWSAWESLGGEFTSNVAVILSSEGLLEAFGRGTNDELYVASQKTTGGWTGWDSLGGKVTSDPSVVMNKDGRLEVFVRGADDVPFHKWEKTPGGEWSDWESLGGKLSSDQTVILCAEGRINDFAVGTNGAICVNSQKTAGGAWTGWESLGGVVNSRVAAVLNHYDRLEIFARGGGDAMFHKWVEASGDWSSWESLGGKLTSQPSIGMNKDGRLELFGRGTDDELFHIWQETPGSKWSGWSTLGGKIE